MSRIEEFHAGYGGRHRPDDSGPPLHDLTEKGNYMDGSDVYENPHFFTGTPHPQESFRQIRQLRGKPEGMATVYRAGPKAEFNPGDWVTLSRRYAQEHSRSQSPDEEHPWPVHAAKVPAKHVRFAGDDLNEFGYHGPRIKL